MRADRTAFLSALLLVGCTRTFEVKEPSQSPEGRTVLLAVPFFPDHTDQCGPSALDSVLSFWGKKVDPDELKNEIYVSRLRGSIPVDLLWAARAHGMSAMMLNGGLGRIKDELDAGHPLIAMIDLGYAIMPIGHYVVLTGYDDRRQVLFVHSGLERNSAVPYTHFLREWRGVDRWALLVLPASA